MIFISVYGPGTGVFFGTNQYHPFGDLMNKSGTLIVTALLTLGFAAASIGADAPKSAAPTAAGTGTAAPATSTKSSKSSKSGKSSKSSKNHKKSTPAAPAPAPAATK